MDIPPVPNQLKTFRFPQRCFGKTNPVKRSFKTEHGYIMMKQMTSRSARQSKEAVVGT